MVYSCVSLKLARHPLPQEQRKRLLGFMEFWKVYIVLASRMKLVRKQRIRQE
jgi:hypothetical protein